jgi:hypothetical protein
MILSVRFAVVPLLETLIRPRDAARAAQEEQRLARLEEKVGQLGRELERLSGRDDIRSAARA